MDEKYVVGNVISIDGLRISVLMNEQSNLESFHYNGIIYDGISIGSYIGIIRGSHKVICRVEKEFLQDKKGEPSVQEFSRERFERYVEVSLIGDIYKGRFEFGIKRFPMIFNEAVLPTENEIRSILQKDASNSTHKITIGKSVSNNISVDLAWDKLFHTHIGIFGNTGSGKSNTLTKTYTELFAKENNEIKENFGENSKFVILDFNGEYIKDGVLRDEKKRVELSTHNHQGSKLHLTPRMFWDIETLSILYSATEKTQRPFLGAAIKHFVDTDSCDITPEKIIHGLGSSFYNIFRQNNNKDMLNLLHKSLDIIDFDTRQPYHGEGGVIIDLSWLNAMWHSQGNTFYTEDRVFINSEDIEEINQKRDAFEYALKQPSVIDKIQRLTLTEKLRIAVHSQLIYYLAYGRVNFEHINPLIQRIESRSEFIEKTIDFSSSENDWDLVNVISFRRCNSEAKKMIPLLVTKQLYDEHKKKAADETEITKTVHLIIDEAHNILSSQSIREEESWKDYRLEVFEEIIKEGRKFGFYITLASQRPYDISPTIVSQLHNYFIHRLVNEQDLRMIANTVNTLDTVSRNQIPTLAPGQCIITGTSFEMPLLIQVDKLSKKQSPASENADLIKLWAK